MTVCREAGPGTEAAAEKVADEIVHKRPDQRRAAASSPSELRAGAPRERRCATSRLRTGVDEVQGFRHDDHPGRPIRTRHALVERALRLGCARCEGSGEETAAKVPLQAAVPDDLLAYSRADAGDQGPG